MMRRYAAASSPLLVAALAGGCTKHVPLRNVAEHCPLPADARGYPVSVTSADARVDSIFLRQVGRAVARRFSGKLVDPKKDTLPAPALDASIEMVDQGELLGRGSWRPTVSDTGRIVLAYRRSAARPELRLTHGGQPTAFEALLQQAVRRAMLREERGRPSRDPFPMGLPAGGPDSALVTVAFGSEPVPGTGVARFALQEQAVRAKGTNRPPSYPTSAAYNGTEGKVTLAYVVRADSTPDMSTVLVVRTTGAEFSEAALAALPNYRYLPAQLDCRPVPQLVEQPFTFEQGKPNSGQTPPPTLPRPR